MSQVYDSLGPNLCKALPGLHALTGCDTVSAFAGKGKLKAFKILEQSNDFLQYFISLGSTSQVAVDTKNGVEAFVCRLYLSRQQLTSVNELRYSLFTAKKGFIDSCNLPPCQNALYKHIIRANYQSFIWKMSLNNQSDLPKPENHGWIKKNDNGKISLDLDWMDCSPAPDSVLEFMPCACLKACIPTSCSYIKNNLQCTDMCRLKNCTNTPSQEELKAEENYDLFEEDSSDED